MCLGKILGNPKSSSRFPLFWLPCFSSDVSHNLHFWSLCTKFVLHKPQIIFLIANYKIHITQGHSLIIFLICFGMFNITHFYYIGDHCIWPQICECHMNTGNWPRLTFITCLLVSLSVKVYQIPKFRVLRRSTILKNIN